MRILFLLIIAYAGLAGILHAEERAGHSGGGRNPAGDAPVALRMTPFTVPPATGPVVHAVVQNRTEEAYTGTVSITLPDGWKWSPDKQDVTLAPSETKRIPFAIDKAVNLKSNRYNVAVHAEGGGRTVERTQSLVCASAPYLKAEIDGDLEEWNDSPAVRWTVEHKETVIQTYWTRRTFFLAVTVEEDDFKGYDAIQFALAPRKAETPSADDDDATRYEFLVTGDVAEPGKGICYSLLQPGTAVGVATEERAFADLDKTEAMVSIAHKEGVTIYECAIPFKLMSDIRPTEGREFCFSLLVHDPDGTGLRDWGEAAGLWPWQRSKRAWCSWKGVQWGDVVPYDGKVEWGLCSSIH